MAVLLASHGWPGNLYWNISGQKVQSKETKVTSPQFFILLPGESPHPFQLVLYAEARSPKWGSAGFQRARGRGRIELRSKSELLKGTGKLTFSVEVGSGQFQQPPRPAMLHDFSEQPCCGLRRWDFASAVDPMTQLFTIRLSIEPSLPATVQGDLASCGLHCVPMGDGHGAALRGRVAYGHAGA